MVTPRRNINCGGLLLTTLSKRYDSYKVGLFGLNNKDKLFVKETGFQASG